MGFSFGSKQRGGGFDAGVGDAIPIGNGASHAAAYHIFDLRMDLRRGVRNVTDAHVVGLTEPAEPGSVDFRGRSTIEERADGELADISCARIAVRLRSK